MKRVLPQEGQILQNFAGQGIQTTNLQSVAVSCIIYFALCLFVMVFATVKASRDPTEDRCR